MPRIRWSRCTGTTLKSTRICRPSSSSSTLRVTQSIGSRVNSPSPVGRIRITPGFSFIGYEQLLLPMWRECGHPKNLLFGEVSSSIETGGHLLHLRHANCLPPGYQPFGHRPLQGLRPIGIVVRRRSRNRQEGRICRQGDVKGCNHTRRAGSNSSTRGAKNGAWPSDFGIARGADLLFAIGRVFVPKILSRVQAARIVSGSVEPEFLSIDLEGYRSGPSRLRV